MLANLAGLYLCFTTYRSSLFCGLNRETGPGGARGCLGPRLCPDAYFFNMFSPARFVRIAPYKGVVCLVDFLRAIDTRFRSHVTSARSQLFCPKYGHIYHHMLYTRIIIQNFYDSMAKYI